MLPRLAGKAAFDVRRNCSRLRRGRFGLGGFMDWTEIAKGLVMADLFKAGVALGVACLAALAYAIANWLGK